MSDRCGPPPWLVRPGFGDAPVGTVVAFAGQLGPPDPPGPAMASPPLGTISPVEAWGWMACDGRSLATDLYPELFQALAYLYGGQDGSFNLPDYGGYFMRGIGGTPAVDPDADTRTKAAGGTADGVGSTQLSALLSHEHEVPKYTASLPGQEGGTDMGAPPVQDQVSGPPVDSSGKSLGVLVSLKETRPVNIYVNYIIKFTSGFGLTWPGHPDRGE